MWLLRSRPASHRVRQARAVTYRLVTNVTERVWPKRILESEIRVAVAPRWNVSYRSNQTKGCHFRWLRGRKVIRILFALAAV
jgi:hypothetical protein